MEEIWKDIKGFEGKYQVSNLGRVKSFAKSDVNYLKGKLMKNGYILFNLSVSKGVISYKKGHRLVAEHFIPNPDNLPVVNHIDGDKQNNILSNLEWCTYQYNNRHYYSSVGVITFSNLLYDDFQKAIDLYNSGYSYKQLNEEFDLTCRQDNWGKIFSGQILSEITGIKMDIRRKTHEEC